MEELCTDTLNQLSEWELNYSDPFIDPENDECPNCGQNICTRFYIDDWLQDVCEYCFDENLK